MDSVTLFESKYTRCYLVDTNESISQDFEDRYEADFIRFKAQHGSSPRMFECKKPRVSSPVLDCVFIHLCSNKFKTLTLGTKMVYIGIMRRIFDILESGDNLLRINSKGFWRDFFKHMTKNSSITEFNNTVRLLRSSCEQAENYGVAYCKEIKNALNEFPKTISVDPIPRSTLGEKLLGKKNSANREKRLWKGFNSFIEEAGNIMMHHYDSLTEHYGDDLESAIEFWEKNGLARSWGSQPLTIKNWTIDFINNAYDDKDEKLLSLHKFTTQYLKNSKPSDHLSLFYSERLKRIVKVRNSKNISYQRIHLSIHLLKPTYIIVPAFEELLILKFLLSKWQFSPSMISSMTPMDITLNPSSASLQVSENKDRSGSNPDTTRGHLVIFKQNTHRFEFGFIFYLLNKIKRAFDYLGVDSLNTPISELGVLGSNQYASIGVFENPCLLNYDVFSKDSRYFMNTWLKSKKIQQDSFSISVTHISQTHKVMLFDYKVEVANGDIDIESGDDVVDKMESNQRAHTIKTDINVYESRNLSPVLLEADHLVGKQVADLMASEAKAIDKHLKNISLSEVRDFYGLSTESERLSNSDFTEFISKTGKDVTEYLGIKDDGDIIIVKHPLVLAMIKLYIKHIDASISELIIDQLSPTSVLSDKVIQIEALRMVIASLAENFDEVLHSQADRIINNYELPSFPPLL